MYNASFRSHRPSDIRRINRQSIVSLLSLTSPVSVADVVNRLGLSKPSATSLMKDMVETGILVEVGLGPTSSLGGKQPMLYAINGSYRYSVVVNIEDSCFVDCFIIDMNCNTVASASVPITKEGIISNWQEIIHGIVSQTRSLLKENNISDDSVCLMVLECGGIVDRQNGISKYPIRSRRKINYPVVETIQDLMNAPFPIVMDNMSRYLGFAELKEHPEMSEKRIAVLHRLPSGGVGGCIIERGNLLYGKHGLNGEFGHIQVETGRTYPCSCGSEGCLESMVSDYAIQDQWNELHDQYPDESAGGEKGDLSILLKEANEGNSLACALVSRVALYLARALRSILLSYDPDQIILQGVWALGGDYLMTQLKHELQLFPRYNDREQYEIIYSNLQDADEATVIGGALYARNYCFFGLEE